MSTRLGIHPTEVECGGALLCFLLSLWLVLAGGPDGGVRRALLPVLLLVGSGIALAWVVRVCILLFQWRRRRGCVREHKLAWLAFPVLSLALLGVVTVSAWSQNRPLAFDGPRWRGVAVGGSDTARWRMLNDLKEQHLGSGMRREAALAVLGPPDQGAWDAPRMLWWLRNEAGSRRALWLEILFEDGRLRGITVLRR